MPRPRQVTVVYGTRPEAIKCAPLVLALQAHPVLTVRVVVTGQHRAMLDQVNALFGIAPDSDLNIHQQGQTLPDVTCRTLRGIAEELREHPPDMVLVQGDTTSALGATLAAFYAGVPVAHLEAGLRTGDLSSPFPEEGNRRLIGSLAALHLAPTSSNRENLLAEGVAADRVLVTGNPVIDALHTVLRRRPAWSDPHLAELAAQDRPSVLVTAHRRESWGAPMEAIGRSLAVVARRHPDHDVVVPVHANPAVREALSHHTAGLPNVHLVEPASYGDFCRLLERASVVLTDSGGVQEEAPALGKPVLVMRDNTERPEGLASGTVRLIGTDHDRIVTEVSALLSDAGLRRRMSEAVNPYGDGRAAERCVGALAHWFDEGPRPADFRPTPRRPGHEEKSG